MNLYHQIKLDQARKLELKARRRILPGQVIMTAKVDKTMTQYMIELGWEIAAQHRPAPFTRMVLMSKPLPVKV